MPPRPVAGQPLAADNDPEPSPGARFSEAPSARATAVSASPTRASSSAIAARSTRWPPTVTCAPESGFASRSETASVTWLATVRPKRESHIFWSGSSFAMVPVASPSAMTAPFALLRRSVNVSSPSSSASSSTVTDTVFAVSPSTNWTLQGLAG